LSSWQKSGHGVAFLEIFGSGAAGVTHKQIQNNENDKYNNL
jgi:hypothetical protein